MPIAVCLLHIYAAAFFSPPVTPTIENAGPLPAENLFGASERLFGGKESVSGAEAIVARA